MLTIYNRERGKGKPDARALAAWASVRGIGKREAWPRVEEMERWALAKAGGSDVPLHLGDLMSTEILFPVIPVAYAVTFLGYRYLWRQKLVR